jgi:transposase-like protein
VIRFCSRDLLAAHGGMVAPASFAPCSGMELHHWFGTGAEPLAREALLTELRRARFAGGVSCPHCGCRRIHRWGRFADRQRYRCMDGCGRTFSDLTGTPAAYIKKLLDWPAYSECLASAVSVRAAAARIHVHPSTAFRWRHRLLAWLKAHDREQLEGWIEVGLIRFAESRKGRRVVGRPPRRRALAAWEWYGSPRAMVVVGCDRRGHVIAQLLPSIRMRPKTSEAVVALEGRLDVSSHPPRLVAGHGPLSLWYSLATQMGIALHDSRSTSLLHGTDHQRTYCRRLRRWIARFRGVSTRYLPHYLIWHHRADSPRRHGMVAALLRWPVSR